MFDRALSSRPYYRYVHNSQRVVLKVELNSARVRISAILAMFVLSAIGTQQQ